MNEGDLDLLSKAYLSYKNEEQQICVADMAIRFEKYKVFTEEQRGRLREIIGVVSSIKQ